MTDHANELYRHAYKIGRPAGDTPAVMQAAAAHIEHLERELRAAEIRLHDVATHCATVEAELAEIKRRTCVAVTCNHVARMERAEARVAELEAERAEREKQKPAAFIDDDECFQGPCRHATAFVPMPRGTPLYAAPPVTSLDVPVFWYRPHGYGPRYDGPLHDSQIEQVQRESGAWVPLFAKPIQPARGEG